MNIEHSHRPVYDRIDYKTGSFSMKQFIFWIMVVLALLCVVSFGMVVVNYSVHARL